MTKKFPNPLVKGQSGYFGKTSAGHFTGPSGKHFDLAQVKMFYARGGKFPGQSAKANRKGWNMAAHQHGTEHATRGRHL